MSRDDERDELIRETFEADYAASFSSVSPAPASPEASESERILRSLYASSGAMMGVVELVDDDLRFVDFCANTAKFLRRLPAEIRGKRAAELGLDADARAFWVARYKESQASAKPLKFERITHWTLGEPPPTPYWLCCTISYIGLGANGLPRFTFLVEDVSERKIKEQALQSELRKAERDRRKANKRVANILDSIHDAFLALDRNSVITYTNGRAEDLLRRPRAQLLGQNFWDAFPILRSFRIYEELQNALARQSAAHFQDYYYFAECWLEHDIYPSQEGVFLYSRDITAHQQAKEELRQGVEKLQRGLHGFVQAMSRAVDTRDPHTAGHQRRVSILAARIAQQLGYAPERVEGIRIAGLLHDIGKLAVPAEILSRPGKLSPLEFSLIQQHAQAGYDILKDIEFAFPVALVALQHHERLDGSGYPQGLRGEAIHPESRLMAVADVVEAMASHRPYRPALGLPAALTEITLHRDTRYDGDMVDACFEVFRAYAFDFEQALEE